MLVENGLAYTCPVGDLVHTGGVVAAIDEYLAGGTDQLAAPFISGQPPTAPCVSLSRILRRHRRVHRASTPGQFRKVTHVLILCAQAAEKVAHAISLKRLFNPLGPELQTVLLAPGGVPEAGWLVAMPFLLGDLRPAPMGA
ncbi:Uncharacterised protein [Mycobacteroides abscessus subsp. abscessus]|nr:Uncharacterised protein [Mycobacteroides abscessus subsp. abscessus]